MTVSDTWSTWSTTPASDSPPSSATPEIDAELRNIKAQTKANCVDMSANQTIAGVKTFSSCPIVPTPTTDYQAGTKKYADDLFAAVPSASIPAGTKMAFFQAAVPTGWTQDTSQNDKVFRVVSGTGGGTGGSWTISGLAVASGTFSVNYGFNYGTDGAGVAASSITAAHTHNLTADGNWRPAYIDCVIGTKN